MVITVNNCSSFSKINNMDILKEKIQPSQECSVDRDFLQQRLRFYNRENEKLEKVLKLLRVLEDDGAMCSSKVAEVVENVTNLQEKFAVDRFYPVGMSMVYLDHLYKTDDACGPLQKYMEVQDYVHTKLSGESKDVDLALAKATQKIKDIRVPPEELKVLQAQLDKYQAEISSFERHYPWLKDPTFNLLAISDKIRDLKILRDEELKLTETLDQYQGLQPDVAEARQQLIKLKNEYDTLSSSVYNLLL